MGIRENRERRVMTRNSAPTGNGERSFWWVYMIECRGGKIYTGIAKDPEARFRRHLSGKGAAFTRINPPRVLLGKRLCASRGEALREEHALRKLTRREKIAWANGAATT
jgi:putative endonuclease